MSAAAETTERPPIVDVSELGTVAFGSRSPVWWGVLLLCLIEGTTLAILFVAYPYVRGNFQVWPPSERIPVLPGVLCAGTLIASLVPMWMSRKAALSMDRRRTRNWLLIGSIVSAAAVPFRVWQIDSLPFSWSENAYASIVWTATGFHCVEGLAGVIENILLTYLFFRGPLEKKHFEDVEVQVLFWGFVVVIWIPFAALFLIDGGIR